MIQVSVVSALASVMEHVCVDVHMPRPTRTSLCGRAMCTCMCTRYTDPHRTQSYYSRTTDNGTQVFEGERYLTRDNQLLGRFLLDGIRPSMPGDNNIRVSFTIDLHNDLHVTATDLFSGVTKVLAPSISPQPNPVLSLSSRLHLPGI